MAVTGKAKAAVACARIELLLLLILGCFVFVLLRAPVAAAADTYTVGGDLAWTVPPTGEAAYKSWAAGKSFDLGDTIVFNWTGEHTVARVSKDVYDNCTTANVLANDTQSTSPVSYTLNSTQPQYFICTVGPHCSLGQKVTITISSSSSSSSSLPAFPPTMLFLLFLTLITFFTPI